MRVLERMKPPFMLQYALEAPPPDPRPQVPGNGGYEYHDDKA